MNNLIFAVILLLLGLALVVMEVLFASGGLLGFLALVVVSAAVVFSFRAGNQVGMLFIGVTLFAAPGAVILALKVLPRTPMGKQVMLQVPKSEDVLPQEDAHLRKLVGRVGRATCLMLPSGAIDVDGEIYNALSEGVTVEKEQLVQVVSVRGNQVIVKPWHGKAPPTPEAAATDLSRSLSELGLDFGEEGEKEKS